LDYYEQAWAIHERIYGKDHADTAGSYHNVGIARQHLGDRQGALHFIQTALNVRQHLHAQQQQPNSHNTRKPIAASHIALGHVYAEMGHAEGALEQYQAALTIQQDIYGPQSVGLASTYNHIGAIHYQQRQWTAAYDAYTHARDLLVQNLPPNHPDVAAAWNNVGLTLLHQPGRLEECKTAHTTAYNMLTEFYGSNSPQLAVTLGCLGNVYKAQEEWALALDQYQKAHAMLESLHNGSHPDIASSWNNIGLVLSQQGRLDEALTAYQSAQQAFAASLGADHVHTASCHFNIGLTYQHQGKKKLAVEGFETAHRIWHATLGPDHPQTQLALQSSERLL
jgi:tetratricopeptide (TPR) repeat protein